MVLSIRRRRDEARCRCARVWLNGIDVTALCFYADGRRGVVRLYRVNGQGKKFLDTDPLPPTGESRVATEERRGRVELMVRAS